MALKCLIFGLMMVLMEWSAYGANTCQNRMDLVMVLEDTDALADPRNEYALKEFLSDLVDRLIVGRDDAHVAVQLYNDETSTVFNLNKYSTTADVKSAILLMPTSNKPSQANIDSALSHTWENMLTVANGERSCYPTVVLLTSYSSNLNPSTNNDLAMVKQLQDSGALVVVLGIGPNRDPEHLITLAGGLDNYYDFSRFTDLNASRLTQLVQQICDYSPNGNFFPCPLDALQADVTFVVDVSSGMNSAQNEAALSFMSSYMRPFTFGKRGVQAAMVSYAKDADVTVSFKDTKDHPTFMNKVQHVVINGPYGPDRYIANALEAVLYHVLTESAGQRPNVTQTVIIFGSDCFNGPDATALADAIRTQKGADIHLVSFSKSMGFWKQHLDIAGDARHLYTVPNNPDVILPNFLTSLTWRSLCERANGGHTRRVTSTPSLATTTPIPQTIPPPAPTLPPAPEPLIQSTLLPSTSDTAHPRTTSASQRRRTTSRPGRKTTTQEATTEVPPTQTPTEGPISTYTDHVTSPSESVGNSTSIIA